MHCQAEAEEDGDQDEKQDQGSHGYLLTTMKAGAWRASPPQIVLLWVAIVALALWLAGFMVRPHGRGHRWYYW